jgi:hypothetical protein
MTDFRTQLTAGFKAVRAAGYFGRQSWKCCQSCGCAAMPEGTERYAFYHAQDRKQLVEAEEVKYRGNKPRFTPPNEIGVYLSWGGDGNVIAKAFRDAGCTVEWDGKNSTRIWVCAGPAPDAAAEAGARSKQKT